MSQVIDTKVVEMQFDGSKFEKNIEVCLNSLKFLNKSLDEAGKNRNSLDELAKAGDQVGVSFDNMNMKSRISLNMMDMLAGVGTKAFNRISDAVAGFAMNLANSLSGMQAMRDGFNEYELKMGSVQTILAGAKIIDPTSGKELKNEAERLEVVNQKLEALNAYSDRTIYSFKDMTSNIGKFTNAGVNLSDAVDAIQGVANVAAISGANAGEASRAMYNFAQALSSGYVKLIDWKSIENANMATVDFKQQLLDTALALGTVRKEGEMYITTTTDAQGKISEAFDATKMFNDSLSHQWMTTDVLTTTLKKYTDESTELGKKAFAAATEVKTFSQMMDTLKESLGSGWAQTFEIIFGNFTEAKDLWTRLNNTIDGMLSPIGEARNAILKIWKADGGRDAMINSFSNLWKAVQNLVAPLKDLWKALTPNIDHSGKILSTITKLVEKLTAVIAKAAGVAGKVLAFVLKPFIFIGNKIGNGLIKFVGLVRTAFSKIVTFFTSIKQAVSTFANTIVEAFDKHITSRVKTLQSSLAKFFNNLKTHVKNNAAIQKLSKAFHDLKEVIQDLFGRVLRNASFYASSFVAYLGRIWNAVSPLVSSAVIKALKTIADFLLPKLEKALTWVANRLRNLGNLLSKIDIKKSKFYKTLSELPNKLTSLADSKAFSSIKKFASTVKGFGSDALTFVSNKFKELKANMEAIKMPKGLSDVFENVKNFIKSIFGEDSVKETLSDTMDKATESISKFADEQSSKKLTAFQKFLQGISDAFDWLKSAAKKAKKALEEFVGFVIRNTPKAFRSMYNFIAGDDGMLTMSDLTDVLYEVSNAMSTLLASVGVEKFGNAANNVSEALGDMANAFTVFLKRVSNKMRMEALRDFAIAIGIVVASLYLLSKIPTDKLLIASGVLLVLGGALAKFFDMLSNGNMDISKTIGNLSIGALLLSIGAAMIGVALSVGILVAALAMFPKVIKQYNNLGDAFKTGMGRVKEVLEEIFEYLDHTVNAKYGFRSAAALLGLVMALSLIRKTIVKYANKETGEAMEEGLARIKEVLDLLGEFFSSVSLASFSFINIGVDFDMVGMAAMIWALGNMIDKIADPIAKFAAMSPSEFAKGFGALELIFFELGAFLTVMGGMSKLTGTSLGQWLGMAANVTLLASTINSIVGSLKTMTDLAGKDPDSFKTALSALTIIFIELVGTLAVIGEFKPSTSIGTLFGLSICIGMLTSCVVALSQLAATRPNEMWAAVGAVGVLMIALGGALMLTGLASQKTTVGDIVKVIVMTGAMVVLAGAIRRLAKTGGDPGSIVAAGAAIAGAALAMAGAMKILGSVKMINPMVLVGLAILAAAIWGVAFAISAFKGTSGQMTEASANVSKGAKEMEGAMEESTSSMAAYAKDALPPIISELGESFGTSIKEALSNINLSESIRNMIETVKSDAKNWAQDFLDIGTNIIDGLSQALENPANAERVKASMQQLGKALLEGFKNFLGIASPSTVMIEQGGYVIDGLVQGLMQYPEKLGTWLTGIGTYIKDGISGFFSGAVEKGKEFVDNLGTGIQNGKDAIGKKAAELGNSALKKVGKAKEWAKQAGNSASAFGNKLRSSGNPIKSAAGSMIVGAVNVVHGIAGAFKSFASGAASGFTASIRAGAGPARAAAHAIVSGAKAAFSGISSSFSAFGRNAAQGFRNGINSLISSVAAKARAMVRAAKDAAKSEQNSNSPSKDFMEFGGWAAEGYAIGMTNQKSSQLIEKNARMMVDSAKRVASNAQFGSGSLYLDSNPALTSLAYAMGQISDTLDESMDSSPTIRPVIDMSNVTQGASAISTLFGDKQLKANIDATRSIQDNFDRTLTARNGAASAESIKKLANKLNDLTDTMNSRTMNNYITVDGAENPQLFADKLVRSMRLNARTI